VIEVETVELALSLQSRLEQLIPNLGERGVTVRRDAPCGMTLGEFPRRANQVQSVLDGVAAWLDEVGHPEVTVQFHWRVSHSPEGRSRAMQPVLYWKYEDGPADAGPHASVGFANRWVH
jgi:hypothetical protein